MQLIPLLAMRLYSTHKANELGQDTLTLVCGMIHSVSLQMMKLRSLVIGWLIKGLTSITMVFMALRKDL